MVEKLRPPTFYTVLAGTQKAQCRVPDCKADIYFVDSLKTPGKKIPIDCSVVGGRVPSQLESGSGIIHHITCTDPSRFREKRPPARRHQRELPVDHRSPACIFCGCTQTTPCSIVREEMDLVAQNDLMKRFDVESVDALPQLINCSWLQLDPPICSAPACRDRRAELPLRMKIGKRGKAAT